MTPGFPVFITGLHCGTQVDTDGTEGVIVFPVFMTGLHCSTSSTVNHSGAGETHSEYRATRTFWRLSGEFRQAFRTKPVLHCRVPSCFDRVGELLLDVGVLRVIAVSLSGSGPFTSRRIIDGLCDNLTALAEHIWGVTYSAV